MLLIVSPPANSADTSIVDQYASHRLHAISARSWAIRETERERERKRERERERERESTSDLKDHEPAQQKAHSAVPSK
jgi:hypothetical protein